MDIKLAASRLYDDEKANRNTETSTELKTLRGNIMAILNKITPDNFKVLSVEMLELNIDNKEKVGIAVEMIFEKAVLEPIYHQTYGNLCKVMGAMKTPEEQTTKLSPFSKALLRKCQIEFFRVDNHEYKLNKQMGELHLQADLVENEKQNQGEKEDSLYKRSKLKKRMLGTIQFIGVLFNMDLLSTKIITQCCLSYLLTKKKEGKLGDEVVECISKLFSTVGLKLENECDVEFEKGFRDFRDLGSDPTYGSRIRFMIQDTVELRHNNWIPRRIEAMPQTIEDIHNEYAREKKEKEVEAEAATRWWKSQKKREKNRY
ncbi:eukaryotic translation initiation factor 4 gamma 1-like isoform X1 [Bolinopsis microptera]|uniref:eukaryotic translation initiation factor 4 gamma 1-like isoform X1 n=1 Tax=Bolinopsis microptera TaxID=2820187 RepID=UPI003078C30F